MSGGVKHSSVKSVHSASVRTPYSKYDMFPSLSLIRTVSVAPLWRSQLNWLSEARESGRCVTWRLPVKIPRLLDKDEAHWSSITVMVVKERVKQKECWRYMMDKIKQVSTTLQTGVGPVCIYGQWNAAAESSRKVKKLTVDSSWPTTLS